MARIRWTNGTDTGEALVRRSEDSTASSILEVSARALEFAPHAATIAVEKVPMTTIDEIWDDFDLYPA